MSTEVFPEGAHSFEVFSIQDSNDSPTGKEAFIGYKIPNGNFHFEQVPYTEPKPTVVITNDSTCEMLRIMCDDDCLFEGNYWDFEQSDTSFKKLLEAVGCEVQVNEKDYEEWDENG